MRDPQCSRAAGFSSLGAAFRTPRLQGLPSDPPGSPQPPQSQPCPPPGPPSSDSRDAACPALHSPLFAGVPLPQDGGHSNKGSATAHLAPPNTGSQPRSSPHVHQFKGLSSRPSCSSSPTAPDPHRGPQRSGCRHKTPPVRPPPRLTHSFPFQPLSSLPAEGCSVGAPQLCPPVLGAPLAATSVGAVPQQALVRERNFLLPQVLNKSLLDPRYFPTCSAAHHAVAVGLLPTDQLPAEQLPPNHFLHLGHGVIGNFHRRSFKEPFLAVRTRYLTLMHQLLGHPLPHMPRFPAQIPQVQFSSFIFPILT